MRLSPFLSRPEQHFLRTRFLPFLHKSPPFVSPFQFHPTTLSFSGKNLKNKMNVKKYTFNKNEIFTFYIPHTICKDLNLLYQLNEVQNVFDDILIVRLGINHLFFGIPNQISAQIYNPNWISNRASSKDFIQN